MPVSWLSRAALCLFLVAAAGGCSDDNGGPVPDAPSAADMAPTDGATSDGATTQPDGPGTKDGPGQGDAQAAWSCSLEPGGGPFTNPHADGCKWEWSCPQQGDRQLYCETVSTAEHTCTCKNLTTGQTEKTFKSVDICTYDATTIAAQANGHCGWQL
jgi:hypothetical protein